MVFLMTTNLIAMRTELLTFVLPVKHVKVILQALFVMLFVLIGFQSQAQKQDDCGFFAPDSLVARFVDKESVILRREAYLYNQYKDVKELPQINYLQFRNGQFFPIVFPVAPALRDIPVVAHVVRRSNGRNGLSEKELTEAIRSANEHLVGLLLKLELCEIRYIDSDDLFAFRFDNRSFMDLNPPRFDQLDYNRLNVSNRNVPNKLNIYFVPNSRTSWTWLPNRDPNTQHILMNNAQALNGTTLVHELGHWFNLFHTHENTIRSNNGIRMGGPEFVRRHNCDILGDFLCDTPADPQISRGSNVSNNCQYIGNSRDVEGRLYSPDVNNFMSYSSSCRNRFSRGQTWRLWSSLLGIEQDRGYLLLPCKYRAGNLVDLSGQWTNINRRTNSITRVEVSNNSSTIRVYGACHPNDCDWGESPMIAMFDHYKVVYNQGFAVRELDVRRSLPNRISVVTRTIYNDGREPRVSVDVLVRRRARG
jgi:hypothetical protein